MLEPIYSELRGRGTQEDSPLPRRDDLRTFWENEISSAKYRCGIAQKHYVVRAQVRAQPEVEGRLIDFSVEVHGGSAQGGRLNGTEVAERGDVDA